MHSNLIGVLIEIQLDELKFRACLISVLEVFLSDLYASSSMYGGGGGKVAVVAELVPDMELQLKYILGKVIKK